MKVYAQVSSLPKTRHYLGEVPENIIHWQAVALTLGLKLEEIVSGRRVWPKKNDPANERFWLLVTYHRGITRKPL